MLGTLSITTLATELFKESLARAKRIWQCRQKRDSKGVVIRFVSREDDVPTPQYSSSRIRDDMRRLPTNLLLKYLETCTLHADMFLDSIHKHGLQNEP